MDITSLVLAKKYTNQTVDGLGYLKGAPATIKSVEKTDGVTTVTFEWTGTSGATETTTMEIADGLKGLSIQSTAIDEDNDHLIITYTDGTTQDAGAIPKQPFEISKDPGNGIDMRADGIYMSSTGVDLSQEEGNILEAKDDGLYATAPSTDDKLDKNIYNYYQNEGLNPKNLINWRTVYENFMIGKGTWSSIPCEYKEVQSYTDYVISGNLCPDTYLIIGQITEEEWMDKSWEEQESYLIKKSDGYTFNTGSAGFITIIYPDLPFEQLSQNTWIQLELGTTPTSRIDYLVYNKANSNNPVFYNSMTLGTRYLEDNLGINSVVVGMSSAERENAVAIGTANKVKGENSLAIGMYNHTLHNNSVTLGSSNLVEGENSLAEGTRNIIESTNAHAEGQGNYIKGIAAHAEGFNDTDSSFIGYEDEDLDMAIEEYQWCIDNEEEASHGSMGLASHTEGIYTGAVGQASHAEGKGTIVFYDYQHVQGKYNELDKTGKYASIIGGGNSNQNRKNIAAVDWNGNATYAGDIEAKNYFILSDINTNTKYRLGISDGKIFIEEC